MKQRKLMFSLIIAAIALFAFACNQKSISEKMKATHIKSFKQPTGVTVQNGMYVFADRGKMDSFLSYLQEADTAYVGFDSTSYHPGIDSIEDLYGFYSLRHSIEDSITIMLANGTWTIENDPDNHYIGDDYYRSILNPDLEVVVGDTIFKHSKLNGHDYQMIIKGVDMNKLALVDQYGVFAGALSPDIVAVPNNEYDVTSELWSGLATDPRYYTTIDVHTTDQCNRPKERAFYLTVQKLRCTQYDPYTGGCIGWTSDMVPGAYVMIDFGDGSPLSGPHYMNGMNPLTDGALVLHTYSSAGTYTVTTEAYDPAVSTTDPVATNTVTIVISEEYCITEGDKKVSWKDIDNRRRFKSVLSSNNSFLRRSFFAKTIFQKKSIAGYWRRAKVSKIYVKLDANYKTDNCTVNGSCSPVNPRTNKSIATVRCRVGKKFGIGPNGVNSTHKVFYNNSWYSNLLAIDPCQ